MKPLVFLGRTKAEVALEAVLAAAERIRGAIAAHGVALLKW